MLINPETFPSSYPEEPERNEDSELKVRLKKPMPLVNFSNLEAEKPVKIVEVRSEKEPDIEVLSDEESRTIFNIAEIHGDEFNGKMLTKEILQSEDLLPKYKAELDGSLIWFSSNVFEISDSRIAVIAYVRKGLSIVARSYYRSNSQGIWRYLPTCSVDDNGEIARYNKGFGEESITLPISIQKVLAEITEDSPVLKLKHNSDLILAGTTRNALSRATYTKIIETRPIKLNADLYQVEGKVSPERMHLSEEQSPNFAKRLTSWKQDTDIYGTVYIDVFASNDGKLKFMFCNDSLGRAWIANVEDDSEIQTTGLKKNWVHAGDLTTPAYEYLEMSHGYGNTDMISGYYVDMYQNYLSKMDVIKEYKEWLEENRKKR